MLGRCPGGTLAMLRHRLSAHTGAEDAAVVAVEVHTAVVALGDLPQPLELGGGGGDIIAARRRAAHALHEPQAFSPRVRSGAAAAGADADLALDALAEQHLPLDALVPPDRVRLAMGR